MKLSSKLSVTILIIGLSFMALSSLAIFKLSYESILKSQLAYTKNIAKEVANDLDLLLAEKVKTGQTLANAHVIKTALEMSNQSFGSLSEAKRKESIQLQNEKWKSTKDPQDSLVLKFTDNEVSRFLKGQQKLIKGEYGEIFLTNKYGALIASTSKLSTFAHGHKYWWLGAHNKGEGAIFFDDRGYDDSVGGYVLGLVVPVKKGREIIGILKCNLNILGSIDALMAGVEDKLLGKVKLSRSGGMVVFEEGFEPLSTRIHDSVYRELKSKKSFIFDNIDEKQIVGAAEVKLTKGGNGYGFGGTFESIDHKKGNTGESWYILCYRQVSLFKQPVVESMKSFFLVGFAVITILAFISYAFARQIAKPLLVLGHAAKRVGEGDFESRIHLDRNDELGNLADSFNLMANKLQQTTISIEVLEGEALERRHAEEALTKSEESLRTIFEQAPIGIALIDSLDGHIHNVNARFAEIAARTLEEMISINWMSITHPDDVQEDLDNMVRLNAGEISGFNMSKRYIKPDGSLVWVDMTIAPVTVEDKERPRHLCMIRDMTAARKIEEEKTEMESRLRQQQKLESLGLLAGGVAHEINNPLNGIMNYAQLIADAVDKDTSLFEDASEIIHETRRVAEIVKNLLTFARHEKQAHSPARMVDIVNGTASLIQTVMRHDQIAFEVDVPEDLPTVKCRSQQIQQVIMNLLTNARDALNEKYPEYNANKKLAISSRVFEKDSQKWLRTIVEDQGVGIDSQSLERLFEPFYTSKPKEKGSGLGLSISYGIVLDHHGDLHVESKHGEYTRFYMDLPLDNGWKLN